MTTLERVNVTPLPGAIGATIDGLDLRDRRREDIATVGSAVLRHRVVFLRGQDLDDEGLRSFAGTFGPLARTPLDALLGRTARTSVIEDTADRPPAGFDWHTDLSWTASPPALGFLHALEIPASGGDTIWSDQVGAFGSLPLVTQDLCRSLRAEHRCDDSLLATVERHHGADRALELRRASRPIHHPLVRRHEQTGEDGLYLSPMYLHHLVGIDRRRGAGLLRHLDDVLEDPRHQVRWRWAEGDVAVWDETTTCHRALADHFPQRRRMRRCVIEGSRPLPAPRPR